jgi:hypothetical protein
MSVAESGIHQKLCAKCGTDVTHQKRFRDAQGNYYCSQCAAPAPAPASAGTAIYHPPSEEIARQLRLVPKVTCPHCWNQFPPDQILWVSQHSELIGDSVLGPEKPRRFLPTRFTLSGQALDSKGMACQALACPRCHLFIPRSVLDIEPLFISIIGGPKTGKSYFLASLTWELRRVLGSQFGLSFSDADTVSNQVLNEYEATLFLPEDPDRLVAIRKTELEGELYDQVSLGGHLMVLPRPFLFNLRPLPTHPHAAQREACSRVLCMYDNAGEHFQPGMDRTGSPVTQHLARSRALIFLFDPTQDPRFREQCRGLSNDPQLGQSRTTQRQETLLVEAALRVRRFTNLPPNAKHNRPLIVVVPKSDVWGQLVGEDVISEPIRPNAVTGGLSAVDTARIERVSSLLRALLLRSTPEVVAAAEDFCEHVIYIPISALGKSPEESAIGEGKSGLFVRPGDIAPRWAAVPILYMLSKWTTGMVGATS